jgi:hypothetical protein
MYELWDQTTLNMIDCYGSAIQAEDAIAETVRIGGPEALSSLVLVQEDNNDESHTVAEGQAILVAVKRLSADERTTAASRRTGSAWQ